MKAANDFRILDMDKRVSDIIIEISWREIAGQYFKKSPSWIYHKLHGNDGGFSKDETIKFKEALTDLAKRIKDCADSIVVEE